MLDILLPLPDLPASGEELPRPAMPTRNASDPILDALAATIAARRADTAEHSYTRQLLDGGARRCAKKLGEEAVETVIAALAEDDDALRNEAADLIYHLLVLLEARQVGIDSVLAVLEKRMGTSGHAEKAARKK